MVTVTEQRQPLGVLPTRAFWADINNEQRGVMLVIILCVGLLTPLLDVADRVNNTWASLALGIAVVLACVWLTKGLVERYIRWKDRRGEPVLPDAYQVVVGMIVFIGMVSISALWEMPLWIDMLLIGAFMAVTFGVARAVFGLCRRHR